MKVEAHATLAQVAREKNARLMTTRNNDARPVGLGSERIAISGRLRQFRSLFFQHDLRYLIC